MRSQADQIAAQQQQIATLENEAAVQRAQITALEARLSALEQNKTTATPAVPGSAWVWLPFSIVGLIGLSRIPQAIRRGRRSS